MARTRRSARRKRARNEPEELTSDTANSIASDTKTPPKKAKTKTKPVGHPRRANTQSKSTVGRRPAPIPKISPPWPLGLEYSILVDIFQCAAYPLENELFEVNPSTKWLVNLATTCKAFHEPALTALYYAPPISRPQRAYGFLARLKSQNDESPINFRAKVRYLSVLAGTVSLKFQGHDPLKLEELVALTPGLKGLDIRLNSDEPRRKRLEATYFEQDTRISHIYQEDLIQSLEKNSISLRKWRWNLRFNKLDPFPWSSLSSIHNLTPFQRLHSLEIAKFHSVDEISKTRSLASIVESMKALEQLKEVVFTLCDIKSYEDTLKGLPYDLESISFRDCSGLTSSELFSFLSSHGGSLRKLTLDYNASLDFGFLGTLAEDCPKLEKLHVDLTIYGALSTSSGKAEFKVLLPEGIIPAWPRTLQHAEFQHLRKWTIPQSEPFFRSFINSAPNLPDLRTLIIKTSLDSGNWRERVPFRDKWTDVIESTFKRHAPDPIRYGPSQTQIQSSGINTASSENAGADKISPASRTIRSTRTDQVPLRPLIRTSQEPPLKRLRQWSGNSENTPFIHGMCDVVEVRMDNMRPAEFQFTEADFLDKEESGDEEWSDGAAEDEDDGTYAW